METEEMETEEMETEEVEIATLTSHICALYYNFYKLQGCPHGDHAKGFNQYVQEIADQFDSLPGGLEYIPDNSIDYPEEGLEATE